MQYIYISLISLMTLYPVFIVVWFMGFIVKFNIIKTKMHRISLEKTIYGNIKTLYDRYMFTSS